MPSSDMAAAVMVKLQSQSRLKLADTATRTTRGTSAAVQNPNAYAAIRLHVTNGMAATIPNGKNITAAATALLVGHSRRKSSVDIELSIKAGRAWDPSTNNRTTPLP